MIIYGPSCAIYMSRTLYLVSLEFKHSIHIPILDKFEVCWSGDDRNILTGSYHNYFHTFGRRTPPVETIFEANIALYNNRRQIGADGDNKLIGRRLRNDINVDNMNFDRKILHCAYHPSSDIVALAVSNNLFLYNAL